MKQIDRNTCKTKVNIICKSFCIDLPYSQVYISRLEPQHGNCSKNPTVVDDYMDKYGLPEVLLPADTHSAMQLRMSKLSRTTELYQHL